MARPRNRSNDTNTKESNKMADAAELSQSDIADLLAGGRARGAGTEELEEFVGSGKAGIEVSLTNGRFAGKEPGSVYQTLTNARKKTKTAPDGTTVMANPEFKAVRVMKKNLGDKDTPDVHVFLINTDLVEVPS